MNKTVWMTVALVVLVALTAALPAFSQPGGPGGPGGGPRGGPGMGGPMRPPPPPPLFELVIAASLALIAAEGLLIAWVAWQLLGFVKARQLPAALPVTVAEPALAPPPPPDKPAAPDAE